MSRLTRWAASAAATAVVLAPALTGGAAHAAVNPALPVASDPFYGLGQTGGVAAVPSDSAAGEILSSRPVTTTLTDALALLTKSGKTFSAKATQVLYRTQNELGKPSATVTTVIKPTQVNATAKSKGVVAYLSYYDGLSSTCDPSYTLQDDAAGGEEAIIGSLLESGYTVTVPDFEGETLDWAAGHEAGWSTLDAIRATEGALNLPSTTKVGTIGYSGGSFAGQWAAELQPTYAPDVNLMGTAIGGIPANLRSLVNYVNSDADTDRDKWFGVVPAAAVSLGRAVGKDFSDLLSSEGQAAAQNVQNLCIGDFAQAYAGKQLSDMIKPGVDFLADPDVKAILDRNEMGTDGTPTSPMLMFNGDNDGLGDGVMPLADVRALATKYCDAGLPVQLTVAKGPHASVGNSFMLQAMGYIADRFAGKPAPSTCAPRTIGDPGPTPPQVTIRALSRGQHDVIIVTAPRGAKVKVLVAGHKKVVGHAVAKKGRATIKVVDHNGKRATHYRVVVAGHRYRVAVR